MPTEGGTGDSCLCVHSAHDFNKGEKCSSSKISAVWEAFPIQNMEDREQVSKFVEVKVAYHCKRQI